MNFGSLERSSIKSKGRQHPLLHYESRRWPGSVFEFMYKAPGRGDNTVYYQCKGCCNLRKQIAHKILRQIAHKFPRLDGNDHHEIAQNVPDIRNVRRSLQKNRRHNIPNITSLNNIPENSTKTERAVHSLPGDPFEDEKFLLYRGQQSNILIFASNENLENLRASEHVICDGNFKFQPKKPFPFYQMYTLHGFVSGESFPLVVALLPNKQAVTYQELFRVLRREILQRFPDLGAINGGKWHFDYESPASDSFRLIFPEATVKRCLFHYGSAINKWLKENGLGPMYNENDGDNDFHQMIRRLVALCLLPEFLVFHVAQDVLRAAPVTGDPQEDLKIQDFVRYYQWWLRPGFIGHWNHWDNNGPKTTNHAEGWHSGLKYKLPHQHPDLGTFITKAQEWHNYEAIRMRNLKTGRFQPIPRRPIDVQKEQEINQAKANFQASLNGLYGGNVPQPMVFRHLDFVQHSMGNKNVDDQ